MELPRINYDYNGHKYRYSYGSSFFFEDQASVRMYLNV